jgi:hypothetical protein
MSSSFQLLSPLLLSLLLLSDADIALTKKREILWRPRTELREQRISRSTQLPIMRMSWVKKKWLNLKIPKVRVSNNLT